MARPVKQGLEYFSFDTDFFSDRKVRRIMNACGPTSTSILICLLCNIYRDKGYYIGWDEELPFDIADEIGVSEGSVVELIKKALQVDFFDQALYEKYNILTSHGIQKRFRSSTLKRCNIVIDVKYWVIDDNNPVNDGNLPEETELLPDESTQKEKKVNKKKEEKKENKENFAAALAATTKRKKAFGENLIPYVEKYSKDTIRAFFDHWSETNKSGTKMRFEFEKTWEVGKRLATWASKEWVRPSQKTSSSKIEDLQQTGESAADVARQILNGNG